MLSSFPAKQESRAASSFLVSCCFEQIIFDAEKPFLNLLQVICSSICKFVVLCLFTCRIAIAETAVTLLASMTLINPRIHTRRRV